MHPETLKKKSNGIFFQKKPKIDQK